ncbi:MAG: site-specific integrase [Candidatus Dormibacteria bacterium]
MSRSAAALVEAPQDAPTEMATLDAEQVKRLLTAAQGDRLGALYVLAVTPGMRQGQLLGLRWQDLDLDHGSLAVVRNLQPLPGLGLTNTKRQKTEKSRHRVELGTLAVEALRAHKVRQADERSGAGDAWEDHDLVFPHVLGHPLSRERLVRLGFEPLLKAAGLPRIRFHDLRHTTATLLLSQGVHPKIVSELLGHSTVAITLNTYSHVTQTMSRAAADTLDSLLQQPPANGPS